MITNKKELSDCIKYHRLQLSNSLMPIKMLQKIYFSSISKTNTLIVN